VPRLFIALEPPLEIKQPLLQLSRAMSGARWQTAAQMHITLIFIGDVDNSRLSELKQSLAQITAAPLTLTIKGVDYFGSNRYPRVLYAKIEPNPAVNKLHKQLYSVISDLGLPLEKRKYQPHITLARLDRTPYPSIAHFLQAEALLKSESFQLDTFHLFSSKLTAMGSDYRIEASFPLH
jgi:2'-5' RNA ligase